MNYKNKYLKYKTKYQQIKLNGGALFNEKQTPNLICFDYLIYYDNLKSLLYETITEEITHDEATQEEILIEADDAVFDTIKTHIIYILNKYENNFTNEIKNEENMIELIYSKFNDVIPNVQCVDKYFIFYTFNINIINDFFKIITNCDNNGKIEYVYTIKGTLLCGSGKIHLIYNNVNIYMNGVFLNNFITDGDIVINCSNNINIYIQGHFTFENSIIELVSGFIHIGKNVNNQFNGLQFEKKQLIDSDSNSDSDSDYIPINKIVSIGSFTEKNKINIGLKYILNNKDEVTQQIIMPNKKNKKIIIIRDIDNNIKYLYDNWFKMI